MTTPELQETDRSTPEQQGHGRLWWYVAGWIVLSVVVLVVALVGLRPHHRDHGRAAAVPTAGSHRPPQAVPVDQSERSTGGSEGWLLHLHYAAVETFHRHGPTLALTGCPYRDCSRPQPLGGYPADFVTVVRAQGSGQITVGPHAGRYLDWSAGSGYWLDTVPRDGAPGLPAGSSAAVSGTSMVPVGTPLRIIACGTATRPGTAGVCARLRAARWTVAGMSSFGADRVLELYVGPETGPGFAAGPWVSTFGHAVLRIG